MAVQTWRGDALAVAQVNTWTFAGTWLATETVTATINGKAVVKVTGSTVIATLIATIQAALAASTITEFTEITWGSTATTITATAATAGVPFAVVLSTNSASGTINGGSSSAGTATTPSAGPADWSTPGNWSSGSVPVTGDDVYFSNNANPCLYFGPSNQTAVTLSSLNISSTYTPTTGGIGLPKTNGNSPTTSYQEYRDQFLRIGAMMVSIGKGSGSGCGRIKIDVGSVQATLTVYSTGSAAENGIPALLFNGTNASNVANLLKGSVGIAFFAGSSATFSVLNVGWTSNQAGDVNCACGSGATLTTINKTGGALTLNSAPTTLNQGPGQQAGDTYLLGGVPTTLAATGGRIFVVAGGIITTFSASATAVVDCREGTAALTFTNATLGAGAAFYDPGKRITFTNPAVIACSVSDLAAIDLGNTFNLQRS